MDLNTLSEKDLEILLNELEMEDEVLHADVAKIEQSIEKEETLDFISPADKTAHVVSESKTKYRLKIQRMALNQGLIKLSDPIPNYDLQALIKAVANKQIIIADKANASANKRIKRLLNSLIPIQIRRIYNMYPWVVKRCPGFIYTTTYTGYTGEETDYCNYHGPEITFWATPDIPYFFRQGTEHDILLQYRGDMVYLVDNAVNMYHKYQKAQEDKALGIATRIVKNKIKTYFDLLTYNPRWFELLYNILKDGQTINNGTLGTI